MAYNKEKKIQYASQIITIASKVFSSNKDLNKYIKLYDNNTIKKTRSAKTNHGSYITIGEYDFKRKNNELYKSLKENIKEIKNQVNTKLHMEITIKIQIHDNDNLDIVAYHDLSALGNKNCRGALIVFFNKKDIKEEYEEIINNQKMQYNALLEAYTHELKKVNINCF